MTNEATPGALGSNDQLGPEERAKLDALLDHIYEYGTTAEGVLRLAAQLCLSARSAERERCIAAIKKVQAAYDEKNGPGPSIEASVCSDCIGAINGLSAQRLR